MLAIIPTQTIQTLMKVQMMSLMTNLLLPNLSSLRKSRPHLSKSKFYLNYYSRSLKAMKNHADQVLNIENSTLFMEDYRPISKHINMREIR